MQAQFNDAPILIGTGSAVQGAVEELKDEKGLHTTIMGVNEGDAEDQILERKAQEAAEFQRSLTILQAVRRYPGAILWAGLISLTSVMENYDYTLIQSLYGLPAFAEKYGTRLENGHFNVSAEWQTVLKQSSKIGQVFGLLFTGWAVDKLGYKRTQLIGLAVMIPCILFQFMAPNVKILFAAQVLSGGPIGVFLIIANMYSLEIAPLSLRPYLMSLSGVSGNVGGLVSAALLKVMVNRDNQWAYRIPFAVQWSWIPFLAIICAIAPPSPIVLVRHGRKDEAKTALRRLRSKHESDENLDNEIALFEYSDRVEKGSKGTVGTYLELFKGSNRRRTEISCAVWTIENLCGFAIFTSGTYFYEQAGLSASNAYTMNLAMSIISLFVFTGINWVCFRYFGRRIQMLLGLYLTLVCLLGVGALGIPKVTPGIGWATGVFCTIFSTIAYGTLIGPMANVLIPEIPSNRLRAKTVALARIGYIFTAVFNNTLTNYMINAADWNWRGKTAFFWLPFCLACTIWTWYRLPETKDRSMYELDQLFEHCIPTRKFKHTDAYALNGSSAEGANSAEV